MKITDFHGGKTNVEAPVGKHNGIYIYIYGNGSKLRSKAES